MYLVVKKIAETDSYLFFVEDPRTDGCTSGVLEGAEFVTNTPKSAAWKEGRSWTYCQFGRSKDDPNLYQVLVPEDDVSQFHLLNGYPFLFSTWPAFLRSPMSRGWWE
jgi:hypothetical protein